MSLRLQLLALGALTLLLPWAGVEMVRQVEDVLRTGLERSLLDSARARVVATALADSPELRRPLASEGDLSPPLYAHLLSRPPRLDGFFSGWQFTRDSADDQPDARAISLGEGSRLWVGVDDTNLHLFLDIVDDDVVHQRVPGETPHGDRVVVTLGRDPARRQHLLLVNSAAGRFRAQRTSGGPQFVPAGSYYERVSGAWQDTTRGYAIEAIVPLSLADGAIGIGVIDSDANGESARLAAATWDQSEAPNALVHELPGLNAILRPFAAGSDRVRIFSADGWVLADSGPLELTPAGADEVPPTLAERFFRLILRRDDPGYETQESRSGRIGDPALTAAAGGSETTAWYRRGADVSAIVAAAVPIDSARPDRGAFLLEQASDPILTLTNQAMLRVVTTTLIIVVVATLGLLVFASLLSWRVTRLARAAESALGPHGEIDTRLPGMSGRDEIGDLSRAFADLLGRLSDYTEYLQTLKSKLSHELRTPLAIVSTSLDNLEHEAAGPSSREYLERLRHGADRLESILQAMTAATRVEQAIGQTERERFDLVAVIGSCLSSYRDLYPGQGFESRLPEAAVIVEGSADLIEQLFDKLIDNAAGFAVPGSAIEVAVEADQDAVSLSVVNRGPLLPESMRHQLFDSLVSVRPGGGDKPHLGLGLYIVMLIAEFHGGRVAAANLADGSGVKIEVVLDRADAGAA